MTNNSFLHHMSIDLNAGEFSFNVSWNSNCKIYFFQVVASLFHGTVGIGG